MPNLRDRDVIEDTYGVEAVTGFVDTLGYVVMVNVLRYIDDALHSAIRNGTYDQDLTPAFQRALDDLTSRVNGAEAQYPCALYIPAGTYPIRALCWNGRVHLVGDGPAATFLVYARPGPTPPARGEDVLIATRFTGGGEPPPNASIGGIADLALLGFVRRSAVDTSIYGDRPEPGTDEPEFRPWHMARHLVVWRAGIDLGFRLERCLIGLCRSDAVLFLRGATNLHVEDVTIVGVGGYAFTLVAGSEGQPLVDERPLSCISCGDMGPVPEATLAPISPEKPPTWHGPLELRSAETRIGGGRPRPGGSELPASFVGLHWSSALPAWVAGHVAVGPYAEASQFFGAGLLRLHEAGAMNVVVEDVHLDVTTWLSVRDGLGHAVPEDEDPPKTHATSATIVEVELWSADLALVMRGVTGRVATSQRPVLVREALTKDVGKLGLLEIDDVMVSGLGPRTVSRPKSGDVPKQVSDYDQVGDRGGSAMTAIDENRTQQVVLLGNQLASIEKSIGSMTSSFVRWRQGDRAIVRTAGYREGAGKPMLPLNETPALPEHWVLQQVACSEIVEDVHARPAKLPPAEISAAAACNNGFWCTEFVAASLVGCVWAEPGTGGRRDLLALPSVFSPEVTLFPEDQRAALHADQSGRVAPGDNVCIVPMSGAVAAAKGNNTNSGLGPGHWHRVVLNVDVVRRTIRLDDAIAAGPGGDFAPDARFRVVILDPPTRGVLRARP